MPLVQAHPEHSFVLLTESKLPEFSFESANLVKEVGGSGAFNNVMNRWRANSQVTQSLKKHNSSMLINANGRCYNTSVPQLLMLPDETLSHSNNRRATLLSSPKKRKERLATSIEKASMILVTSYFAKKELEKKFGVSSDKIFASGKPPEKLYKPLRWQEKEIIKEQYTGGKEYFLYSGVISPKTNILTLFKAFSLFKKRQLSNMQLVLAGKIDWPAKDFEKKISSYKFREAVIIHTNFSNETLAALTGAAYALVNPSGKPGFNVVQLEAMCCGVPVIATSKDAEPANDAALFASANDADEISNQMKLLYKDEHLRSELIMKGHAETEKYEAEVIADSFWKFLTQTVTIH